MQSDIVAQGKLSRRVELIDIITDLNNSLRVNDPAVEDKADPQRDLVGGQKLLSGNRILIEIHIDIVAIHIDRTVPEEVAPRLEQLPEAPVIGQPPALRLADYELIVKFLWNFIDNLERFAGDPRLGDVDQLEAMRTDLEISIVARF